MREADRAVSALATHFAAAGLPANSVIAVQLPNCVEFFLTVLAAHRAGLVVALLPQLWRQAELTMALNRTGARAIVTTSRIDGVNHANLAMEAAAEAFSIRYVAGFGNDLPEGMAPLDAVIAEPPVADSPARQDSRRAAIVTFDVTAHGFRPIPRTHLNLVAGGLVVSLESRLPQGATLLSTVAPNSFAGFTSSLVIWLLVRRHAGAASSVRRRSVRAADRRSRLRRDQRAGAVWRCGCPKPACWPARRSCKA